MKKFLLTGTHALRGVLFLMGLLCSVGMWAATDSKTTKDGVTTLIWQFAYYTEATQLTNENYGGETTDSELKRLILNTGTGIDKNDNTKYTDYVKAGNFRPNGSSTASARYIKYTPEYNGTLHITAKANGKSGERYAYITTTLAAGALPTVGTNGVVAATEALADGSSTFTKSCNVDVEADTDYYIEVDGGVTITEVKFEYTSIAKTKWNAPTFTVGAWDATNSAYPVTISGETGATIQYSLNGTDYSTYSAAVNVAAKATIYAKATGTGYTDSDVASKTMEDDPANVGTIKTVSGTTTTWDFTKTSQKQGATFTGWTEDTSKKFFANPALAANEYVSPTWCEGVQIGANQSASADKVRVYYDGQGVCFNGAAGSIEVTIPEGANTVEVYSAQTILSKNGTLTAITGGYTLSDLAAGTVVEFHRSSGATYVTKVITKYVEATKYEITTGTCTNGTVSADKTEATQGSLVTLSNTPADGYQLKAYNVYKTGDEATTVTVTDGKFTMPAYNVTVSATFKVATSAPEVNFTLDLRPETYTTTGTIADDNNLTVSGTHHDGQHGYSNAVVTVKVPGYAKITIGSCEYNSKGATATVKAGDETIATPDVQAGGCDSSSSFDHYATCYYTTDAETTLTITCASYTPFIKVESVATVPNEYTVTFKNGEETVSTVKVYEGSSIGTLPSVAVTGNDVLAGWYSDVNKADTKATAGTVPTADITYYAVVKTIYTNAAGQYAPEAGDAISFLVHLEKANATATAETPAQIYLANGTYDLGTLINTEVKSNVHIFGQNRDYTLVVNHPAGAGMSNSETLNVRGSNVYMQNFSVRCDVSYTTSTASGVGTAIRTYGDKNIFYNMNMQGNQDTFNTPMGDASCAYVKGGRIEGTVDYICGGGAVWFEGVNLYMNARSNADVIAAPTTTAGYYGYIFNGCTIDGDKSTQDGKYNFARPWKNSASTIWLNTVCNIKPSSAGYTTMMTETNTTRFHEYNTTDAEGNVITGHTFGYSGTKNGVDYTVSNDGDIYLTEAQAATYTYATVLNGWDPEAIIASYNPVPTDEVTISWVANIASSANTLTAATKTSDSEAIATADMSDFALNGDLALMTSPAGNDKGSPKVVTTTDKVDADFMSMTFDVAEGYTFTPSIIASNCVSVSSAKTYVYEISDANNTITTGAQEMAKSASAAELNTFYLSTDKKFTGTVTVKLWVYGATDGYRVHDIKVAGKTDKTLSATLNAYGYATFSSAIETKVPEGVNAYTGSVDESVPSITWTKIEDGIIPANEGVLLKGTASSSVTLTASYTSVANITGNQLKPNLSQKTKSQLGDFIYVLSGENIMRLSDDGIIKANRAYFQLSKYVTDATSSAKGFTMIWNDGETTGISNVNASTSSAQAPTYNLAGQRVNANSKGLVIMNGKKYINK